MEKKDDKYMALGVDSGKKEVKKIFEKLVDNDFPGAFVNIVRDPTRPGWVFTFHMDGDGSKLVQRILMYLETGNANFFMGAADDAVSMNLSDIAASGFIEGKIVFGDVIDINALNLPFKEEIMNAIGFRLKELKELYHSYGFNIFFLGGETADLPQQVQSSVLNIGVYAETKEKNVISGNVEPGDIIYGFRSDGKALWENELNSGIMSNGLTLGRVSTMWNGYNEKYPDLMTKWGKHEGIFKINSGVTGFPISIGQALISPTRQWAILIKILIDELEKKGIREMLHGISLNSGGGATKIGNVGRGILYKKNMPPITGIFDVIYNASGESRRNMYKTFNCGIGLDVVGKNDDRFREVVENVSQRTNVKVCKIGICEKWDGEGNKVELETCYGTFDDY